MRDGRLALIQKRSLPKTELSEEKRQKRIRNIEDNDGNTYQDYYEVNYQNHFLSPQDNRRNLKSPKQSKRFRIFGRPLPKVSSSTRLDESSRDYDCLTESEMPGDAAKRNRHLKREMEKQAKKAYIKTRYSTEGASNQESENMQMKMRQRLRAQLDQDEYGLNMPERPSRTPQQNVYTSNWHPIDYQNTTRPKTHEPPTIRVYENTSNPSSNLAIFTRQQHGKGTIQQRLSQNSQHDMESSQVVNRMESIRQKIMIEEEEQRKSKIDMSKIQPINLSEMEKVNESEYALKKSQAEKTLMNQNSNIKFEVLQSAASIKRQSNSNSHISQYQGPKDVIFQQRPIAIKQQTHHKQPSETATARFAPFGRASIQSNAKAPIFEAISQEYHSTMKRFPSGSIVRTPDFSQSSSGQQYYSGMQQLASMRRAEFINAPISVNQIVSNIPSGSFADMPAFPYDYYQVHPEEASRYQQSHIQQSQIKGSKIVSSQINPPTIVVTEPDKPATGSSSQIKTPSERRRFKPKMQNCQTSINNGIQQQPSSIPALHSNLHYARKNQENLKSVTSIPTVSITKLPPVEVNRQLNNSIENMNSEMTENLDTFDKLGQYLEILDQFATNIVQFDHVTNENGGSDGIVNFYLYKRFLKEKKRLEECVKGGANIFKEIDFLEVTDSELHRFRQNPQNESILQQLEQENRKVLDSLRRIMDYFKKKFKIFPKANLDLDEDFQHQTIYFLNKEVENIDKQNSDARISMRKLHENQLRKAFLFESLFIIEFFNGRFIKQYQDYNQIEDLTAYLRHNKPTYDKEVTKYLMRR